MRYSRVLANGQYLPHIIHSLNKVDLESFQIHSNANNNLEGGVCVCVCVTMPLSQILTPGDYLIESLQGFLGFLGKIFQKQFVIAFFL